MYRRQNQMITYLKAILVSNLLLVQTSDQFAILSDQRKWPHNGKNRIYLVEKTREIKA